MAIDGDAQLLALIIQGAALGVLGAIGFIVRRAYFVIRDFAAKVDFALTKLEDVQDRIGTLEEADRKRANEYQGIRDELMYLKGHVGVPMDKPVTAMKKETT